MILEKNLYPNHPLGCINCVPSSSGKSIILTKLISNVVNKLNKKYIYSASVHQGLYQKLIKCFF